MLSLFLFLWQNWEIFTLVMIKVEKTATSISMSKRREATLRSATLWFCWGMVVGWQCGRRCCWTQWNKGKWKLHLLSFWILVFFFDCLVLVLIKIRFNESLVSHLLACWFKFCFKLDLGDFGLVSFVMGVNMREKNLFGIQIFLNNI